ncbi:hypothetical protein GRI38_01975 [Altererythrobacter aurantiacus]|uniref:Uncharacterized protein n=1 Tax=Parapontixanthobacter aurantiacus TaxID=1463599 RepID=A0A844Z892_9SPHN|nr:hypothetical protein [Parapontixanthobacter aurantiacus]MXO84801.1 hypothetical protein [Parapontixanthobacter aurantiacus]
MKSSSLVLALSTSFALTACATLGTDEASPVQALSGTWNVDLRPSLTDAPYDQPMDLRVERTGELSGTFYGSPILAGRAGTGQGRLCAAWRTSDNSGAYQHSGCLEGDTIVGQSWSEGRNFVLPWTATRSISGE